MRIKAKVKLDSRFRGNDEQRQFPVFNSSDALALTAALR
jgi:hypothetical protein